MREHVKTIYLFIASVVVWSVLQSVAFAQIPKTISYQGFLETAGQPVDTTVTMTVRLYTQAAGGVASWVGTFPTVAVNAGVYSVVLDPAGLAFDRPYYLETEINGSVSASRTALTAVPYALGPWTPDSGGAGTISYGGRVGIGTGTVPQARLELQGNWSANIPALRLTGNRPSLEFFGDSESAGKQWLMHLGSTGPGNLEFYDMASNIPAMSLNPVGGTEPRLQLYAQDGLETVGYQPFLTLTDDNSGYTKVRVQNVAGALNVETQADIIGGLPPSVQISSAPGESKLTVRAQDGLNTVGYQPFLTLTDANSGFAKSRIQGFNGDLNFFPNSFIGGSAAMVVKTSSGNVGIGTGAPAARLDVAGRTRTQSLEITGGGDLVEQFSSVSGEMLEPGTIVSIDRDHAGMIEPSSAAYDRRGGGVVSGAGDVRPGLMLRQDGILDGKSPVAIAGRVYCRAEALSAPIEPGDLLTTSDLPGVAMKAVDRRRSPGTVIGKAMTSLREGTGLVLVLVNLQ
jgi:hypothetical protein